MAPVAGSADTPAGAPLVALERVSREYEGGRVAALSSVTLSVGRGEDLAVVGPSGSGKSTLLHLLSGLDRPTGGRVLFEGRVPAGRAEWARLRSTRIGIVFQAFHLLPTLTAAENVEVPMFGVLRGEGERRRRALELLDRVGLSHRAGHLPGQLSGGERQRAAIARSLANGPALVLADEPTGNLDTRAAREVLALLRGLGRDGGRALVVVTHNPEVAAGADRRVRLVDGRLEGEA